MGRQAIVFKNSRSEFYGIKGNHRSAFVQRAEGFDR